MAIRAFVDPARAKRKLPVDSTAAKPSASAGAPAAGKVGGVGGSGAYRVQPKKAQGVPASALPGTVNNVVPVDKPNVARPPATDPRTALATTADQMKLQRESGDLGSLLKTTTEQYLPQVGKLQTSMGTIDTAQVARMVGEDQQIPQGLPEQQQMLKELALKLQQARETGDMGTANSLGQKYASLVKAMVGQVTGAPSPDPSAPQAGSPTSAGAPAAVNLNAAATPSNLPAGTKPYQVINAGSRSEGYYDETGKFIYGQPPADKAAAASQIDAQKAVTQAATAAGSPISSGDQPSRSGTGGGTGSGSAVPSGETDASVTNPSASTGAPAPYDAAQAWSTRLANPGLKIKQLGMMIPDPAGAQKIQSLIDYDNQFMAGFPPEGQAWVSGEMALEQRNFEQAIAQYPDQWDKIFRDHQTRVKDIQAKWETSGKWEAQLQAKFDEADPQINVKIKALPKQQQDAVLNQAIADMQAGKDPAENIQKYIDQFAGVNTDVTLAEPGYDPTTQNLDQYNPSAGIEIAPADNVNLETDKSKIDAALARTTLSDEGKKALTLQLETIQKRLSEGGGGFSEAELQKMAAPMFEQIDRDLAAQLTASQHDMAAGGYDTAAINAKSQELRQVAATQKKQAAMELVRENMGYKQQGTTDAISALGGISEAERKAGLDEKKLALEGATTTTQLTSEEKRAQAQANLAQKALSQEGELFVWGKKVDENLEAYGFKLDQYKTDKGFDIDRLKIDLDERVAQGELTAEGAKLALEKVKTSIDAAQHETDAYDRRTATIAELRQRAAAGDQDAEYRIQALEVQQELTGLGIKTEHSDKIASLIYGVRAQGLQLSQEWRMFLEQMAATKEAQESSGFMDFVGGVLGGVAGSFAGGVGAAAGSAAGKAIF